MAHSFLMSIFIHIFSAIINNKLWHFVNKWLSNVVSWLSGRSRKSWNALCQFLVFTPALHIPVSVSHPLRINLESSLPLRACASPGAQSQRLSTFYPIIILRSCCGRHSCSSWFRNHPYTFDIIWLIFNWIQVLNFETKTFKRFNKSDCRFQRSLLQIPPCTNFFHHRNNETVKLTGVESDQYWSNWNPTHTSTVAPAWK